MNFVEGHPGGLARALALQTHGVFGAQVLRTLPSVGLKIDRSNSVRSGSKDLRKAVQKKSVITNIMETVQLT